MFSRGGEGRNEGSAPGINDKGLVAADRKTRKDAFYWYKANWSTEPVLYITSRRFTARTQSSTSVKVYPNAGSVELKVYGVQLGQRKSSNHIFLWPDVLLKEGENLIEASETRNDAPGKTRLMDSCIWSYNAP